MAIAVKRQSLGATKALPFRRTPYPGPVGPRSVPEWTVVDLRDLVPLALAQLGHSEFDSGLGSGLSSGKVAFPLRGSCPSPEELPKVGGFLTTRLPGSQAGQKGLNPGCPSGPFRFTSHGQNIRLIRSESSGLPADSQVISRKIVEINNGGSSISSGQWSWKWFQYRHVWRRGSTNLCYASIGSDRHQPS